MASKAKQREWYKETAGMSVAEYEAEATKRFGEERMLWRFVCPGCGYEAAAIDWKNAGAPSGAVGFSCVGRYMDGNYDWFKGTSPCNYTSGGLLAIGGVKLTAEDGSKSLYFHLAPAPDAS